MDRRRGERCLGGLSELKRFGVECGILACKAPAGAFHANDVDLLQPSGFQLAPEVVDTVEMDRLGARPGRLRSGPRTR